MLAKLQVEIAGIARCVGSRLPELLWHEPGLSFQKLKNAAGLQGPVISVLAASLSLALFTQNFEKIFHGGGWSMNATQ